MSDSEAPPEIRGGPIRGAGHPAPPPPSRTGSGDPPAPLVGATDPEGRHDELFQPHYSRTSGSPVPYAVAAVVSLAAAWWGMRWSTLTAGATDPVRSSEWWANITTVLIPSEEVRFVSYSQTRMWISLALILLAAAAVIVWIGRIGTNLRSGQQPFGAFLPLVAFPAWWLLPLSIGVTSESGRSRSDLLVRYLVAFGILFAQFLLIRWPLLNRMWRAGRLPYDLASILLWLPMMIPWMMVFGSKVFSLLVAGERGSLSDAAWRQTPGMLDWARQLTRITSVAILVLLVVVTIIQHIGIRSDRAALDASRARSRDQRLPLLPPTA